MSYSTIENSIDRGEPLTLFEFLYGPNITDAYRYVASVRSHGYSIVAAGRQWLPFQIKHGEITSSGQLDRSELSVTLSVQAEIANLYRVAPPSTPVRLRIWRGHADDGDYRMIWSGRVLTCEWSGAEVELSCESLATSLRRIGLRRFYQYGCSHVLYGPACKASQAANTAEGAIEEVLDGRSLNVGLRGAQVPFNSETLTAGVIRVRLKDGRIAIRSITGVEDRGGGRFRLSLMSVIPDAQPGMFVEVSRGCLHNFPTCRDRFGNTVNFGGFPNIPVQNPFKDNSF